MTEDICHTYVVKRTKDQEVQKLHSNADISIVSQFSEEEVLYAPLATFCLISIVRDDDEYDMEHYTVKLQELGGSSFLSILHIDKDQTNAQCITISHPYRLLANSN